MLETGWKSCGLAVDSMPNYMFQTEGLSPELLQLLNSFSQQLLPDFAHHRVGGVEDVAQVVPDTLP
jgi:hypothetical protein